MITETCMWEISTKSCRTQRTSNLWRMGSVRSTFSARLKEESYLPPIGLAAAITAQRACRDVTMPGIDSIMQILTHICTCRLWLAITMMTCFWHGYCLLLHGLVDGSSVLFAHLVKLVNQTHAKRPHTYILHVSLKACKRYNEMNCIPLVSQNQRPSFQSPIIN
jgi:hypothetical protein